MNIAGETFTWRLTIKDADGALIDPTTVTCKVLDPSGVEKVSGSATKISVGIYDFSWSSAATDTLGRYKLKVIATIGGKDIIEVHQFMLEE